MKRRLIITGVLLMLFMAAVYIINLRSDGNEAIDEDLLIMENIDDIVSLKSGRGSYEYEKLLKETLKNNEALANYLKESKKNINVSSKAVSEFNTILARRDNFYSEVLHAVEGIQDSVFRQVIIDKITTYKSDFLKKRNETTDVKDQLEAFIHEQNDLNIALSVLATLETEKTKEEVLEEEKAKLLDTQPKIIQSIKEGKEKLNK